ncbi:MAG: ABC transporter permease [Candidatus Nanoarchaeia archaeon]
MDYLYYRLKSFLGLGIQLAKANFKLRNEGTWLGIFWYLLNPLLTFLLLWAIFINRLGDDIPNYPLYLLLGILLFNYFQRITSDAVLIIRMNSGIIKSINFPKESLVGGVILSTLFAHLFEIAIWIIFMIIFKSSISTMIFYPIIIIFFSIFCFGFSLILATLGIYFLDLDNVWSFVSKLIWFATPIFYSLEKGTLLYYANMFNPLYYFITIAREAIIYTRLPETWIVLVALGYSLLFLFVGIVYFNKFKNKFAELI